MPFTLLSHQAPVLPLKLWKPRLFSGAALAFGSMAPDLEYILRGRADPIDGHTISGQFVFCLPLTLALVYATRLVVARPLAAHIPDAGTFHLRDVAALSAEKTGLADFLRVVASALIGSFSHLFIDGFTHKNGWATVRIPFLQSTAFIALGTPIPVHRLLQFGGSLVLALCTLAMLRSIGKKRLLLRWTGAPMAERPAPRASRVRFWGFALCIALLGSAMRLSQDHPLRYQWTAAVFWGFEIMQAICFVFVGLTLASLLFGEGERPEGTLPSR